jgi:hypothetical protein
LGSAVGRDHEITVINRSDCSLYYPSLVWVGVGHTKTGPYPLPTPAGL